MTVIQFNANIDEVKMDTFSVDISGANTQNHKSRYTKVEKRWTLNLLLFLTTRLTLCRCSISDSCARVILASFSRFSLNTSHFPVAIISFTSSSVVSLPDTSSCRIMKCLQRSCLVSRPSLYSRITCTCNYGKPEGK